MHRISRQNGEIVMAVASLKVQSTDPRSEAFEVRAGRAAMIAAQYASAVDSEARFPAEAFAALKAGAHGLKLFPAELASPAVVKALLAVLPKGTPLIPVGGIGVNNLAAWRAAGAAGFGLGSSLYKPGDDAATVRIKAAAIVSAWRT